MQLCSTLLKKIVEATFSEKNKFMTLEKNLITNLVFHITHAVYLSVYDKFGKMRLRQEKTKKKNFFDICLFRLSNKNVGNNLFPKSWISFSPFYGYVTIIFYYQLNFMKTKSPCCFFVSLLSIICVFLKNNLTVSMWSKQFMWEKVAKVKNWKLNLIAFALFLIG